MKIISFANQKGGVGKTTTAVTLAAGLALQEFHTLLIDLDPQGHVAFSFGKEKTSGLFNCVVEGQPLKNQVVNVRPNLDILTSDKRTEQVKRHITLSDFRENVMVDLLKNNPYDVVLMDMAPSLDVLHINGLVACDWVLIPTRLDAMAVDGVKEILLTMAEVSRRGYPFEGYSILPTFFDRTTRETLVQFKEIVQTFGSRVWPPIPQDTRTREAPAFGKTLWEYTPNSPVITGYSNGRARMGGYQQALKRIMEIING